MATNGIQRLSAREVHAAREQLDDGGGLFLCVTSASASWCLRYTSPNGKRREMGMGMAHRGSVKQAGESLTLARMAAHKARALLAEGKDPLQDRDDKRRAENEAETARKAAKARERWTLARCARDYHARIVEPNRKLKHSMQWIASLENHVPPALWNAPIDGIKAPQLIEALQGATLHERARNAGDLGETLRRVRQRLDCVFEDAMFFGLCISPGLLGRASLKVDVTEGRIEGVKISPGLLGRASLKGCTWPPVDADMQISPGLLGRASLKALTCSGSFEPIIPG